MRGCRILHSSLLILHSSFMTLSRDGPVCYQAGELPGSLGGNTEQSEDCLTLNIFTNRWVLDRETPETIVCPC